MTPKTKNPNLAKKKNRAEADEIRELIKKAEELGLVSEDLDDRIHDLKADEAADINSHIWGQIRYLYECSGKARVLEILETDAKAKKLEEDTCRLAAVAAAKRARGEG